MIARRLSVLVFGSGLCALVYQVVWMRLFRLIFGASTGATAAVMAVFMGGLGVGSYFLSARAQRRRNPLAMYARLELGISGLALATPLLIAAARHAYLGLGGSATLGSFGATTVRLLLVALVLGPPTVLMGGTLPAIVRALTTAGDRARRSVGIAYAVNTLGAVTGAALATFVLIERLGVSNSLYAACALNLAIGVAGWSLSRRPDARVPDDTDEPEHAEQAPDARELAPRFVLTAAAIVGFAFFAMEIVWYRMLAPILGGSSYSFGLILAIALLGIGLGGALYAVGGRRVRPTPTAFAATCALEAAFIALPYAAGDHLAVLASATRSLDVFGFWGLVASWTVVTAIVVLPAAIMAGYQFPLLVALLGTGRRGVAREVGLAYVSNTAGAIVGSIAAGFGLISLLGAPGLWLAIVALLCILAGTTLATRWRDPGGRMLPALSIAGCIALMLAPGPTAVWRHTAIGAGRASIPDSGPNDRRDWMNRARRLVIWEADGRESSVAARTGAGLAFFVNGKSDGHTLHDAATVIMAPLLGAISHPEPKRGLVIGLGTGTSAGWLAAVPTMEHVDVVEFEPVVVEFAERCGPVNHGALDNPIVSVVHADAREFLTSVDTTYDVIMSEPSNPYRAGIASLYSQDFYRHAARRLGEDGVFVQWLQRYEVDASTLRTVIATMASVFPQVEVWSTAHGDLALAARKQRTEHDLALLAERTKAEPYASALTHSWGVAGVPGLFAGYVAGPGLADEIRSAGDDRIDTDDHPVLEFGFARGIGLRRGATAMDIVRHARSLDAGRPPVAGGELVWTDVLDARSAREVFTSGLPVSADDLEGDGRRRREARKAYDDGQVDLAGNLFRSQSGKAIHRVDRLLLAHAAAKSGDDSAPKAIERLAEVVPVEAELLTGIWHAGRGELREATTVLIAAFERSRAEPWARGRVVDEALRLSVAIADKDAALGRELFEALAEPLAVHHSDTTRWETRLGLAEAIDFDALCVEAHEPFEPHPVFRIDFLRRRKDCYERTVDDKLERARADLDLALASEPPSFAGD